MDHIIQLHLNIEDKSNPNAPAVQIVWLIDRLLEVIAENLSDQDAECRAFRSQLEGLRREILGSAGSEIPALTAENALELCRGQFKYLHARRLERDEYFADIIAFLRKSLINLTGDSRTFHEDLLSTTDRIQGLVELKDVQELRNRITEEVDELNRVVREKQKREQIQFAELSQQILSLQKRLEEAKVEASLDGLTGIANRRNFDFTIQRWVIAHEKNEEPFTVALFDLDNFKDINDSFGHQVGDQVLISTAMEIRKNIRSTDFLARYGGEEFVVLSSGSKLADSQKRFVALLQHIETMRFDCKSAEKGTLAVTLTASCGVAEYALGESANDLIKRADEALYEAKRAGKNQAVAKRRPLLSAFYEGRKRNTPA